MNPRNITVVFSAIGEPLDYPVHTSLKKLESSCNVTVITSKRFSRLWISEGINVVIAKNNSIAYWRKKFRHLLVRSSFLRQAVRIMKLKTTGRKRAFLMPPHNARHFEYLDVLETLEPDGWSILVDSRDLIFQQTPESIISELCSGSQIHLFDEGEKFFKNGVQQLNGLSFANWMWAQQLVNFNMTYIQNVENSPILNSGCIIGSNEKLRELMDLSCKLLTNSLWSDTALLDQASLNVLAYEYPIRQAIHFHKNGEIVLNMCGIPNFGIELKEGQLISKNRLVPIIHQFDRFGIWGEEGLNFSKREYRVQTSN